MEAVMKLLCWVVAFILIFKFIIEPYVIAPYMWAAFFDVFLAE